MEDKIIILGIDSLDPYVILNNRDNLPHFSSLIEESPTFFSTSIYPVDSIPAWASIYTGRTPGNHGLLYVYDVFDTGLSDLSKLDMNMIRGQTVWDFTSEHGYQNLLVFPMMLYPPWEVNGAMISRSPYDMRLDKMRTVSDIASVPAGLIEKYHLPNAIESIWGGYVGTKNLHSWAALGMDTIRAENRISEILRQNERWDLFHVYFSLLDIVQHRLWRYFDEDDPTYPGNTPLKNVILSYYMLFDSIIGNLRSTYPDTTLIVMSDHGHKPRPIKTININEYLLRQGYLIAQRRKGMVNTVRRVLLNTLTRLNIEHHIIDIVSKNKALAQTGKSMYSSRSLIDEEKSRSFLSNFAGIKSYSFGGIEINRDLVSANEYNILRDTIIQLLLKISTDDGEQIVTWAKRREDVYEGPYTDSIYPDIIFELKDDYGIGWDLHANIFGKAYDHKVSPGGHAKNAVLLMGNVYKPRVKKDVSLIDIAPSILDLLGIDGSEYPFDGKSVFRWP